MITGLCFTMLMHVLICHFEICRFPTVGFNQKTVKHKNRINVNFKLFLCSKMNAKIYKALHTVVISSLLITNLCVHLYVSISFFFFLYNYKWWFVCS